MNQSTTLPNIIGPYTQADFIDMQKLKLSIVRMEASRKEIYKVSLNRLKDQFTYYKRRYLCL